MLRQFCEHVGDVLLKFVVHELHGRVVEHALEGRFGLDGAHALDPGSVIVIGELTLLVAEPDDLKDRELHEHEEVLADLGITSEFFDIIAENFGEGGIVDTHAAELHLQFDEFGEVGNVLRAAVVLELDCTVEERAGDAERGDRLQNDLDFLK